MPAGTFLEGFWRLADPKISLASLVSMGLGLAIAAAAGPVHWGWFGLTVLGILAVEVGKNASGEVGDFESGVDLAVAPEDRSPFSGGKRVIVDRLLSPAETRGIAMAAYGVAILAGVVIALGREPGVLGLGVAGIGLAYVYHGAPLRLAYRGAGEAAVALAYGPLLMAGTVLVQRGEVLVRDLWPSLPLGLLVGLFLVANEFPDYRADRAGRKRTLVVRLGRPAASRLFAGLVLVACLLIVVLPLLQAPRGALLGVIALPPAASAARILLAHPEETDRVIPAQARMLLAFVLYALGAGVGVAAWG